MNNNKRFLTILISFVVLLGVIFLVFFIRIKPAVLLNENNNMENKNSNNPKESVSDLPHIEINEDSSGSLYYTDFDNLKQIKISMKENPIEIGQVFGS